MRMMPVVFNLIESNKEGVCFGVTILFIPLFRLYARVHLHLCLSTASALYIFLLHWNEIEKQKVSISRIIADTDFCYESIFTCEFISI